MFGQQIITSGHCYEVQSIKRTWRERLLSWPWRPWVAFKTFHKPAAYRMGNQIVCHPAMLSEIQQAAQHRVQADLPTDCPNGHGPLFPQDNLLFCDVCKFTVSR